MITLSRNSCTSNVVAAVHSFATVWSAILLFATACAALAATPSPIVAQDSHAPANTTAIEYRRIFVPADYAAAWPIGDEKFLPIDSQEFRKLIAAANATERGAVSQPSLVEAIYTGEMRDDLVVTGQGSWKIELHGETPALLPLGDISLAIREAHWQHDPKLPARHGSWGGENETPGLKLEVPRSGVLEFDWQSVAAATPIRAAMAWKLPAALQTRILLTLPRTHRPLVEGGVVLNSIESTNGGTQVDTPRRWELLLGNAPNASLRIVPTASETNEQKSTVPLHDDTTYRLNERGLDITTTLRFDRTALESREISIPLPTGAQLISAQSNGLDLVWHVAAQETPANVQAIVELPETFDDPHVSLMIHVWHPLVAKRKWRLPSLRPKGMSWASGQFELSVAPMLELQQLVPVDCVQTGVVQQSDDTAGAETSWYAAYSPTSGLEVTLLERAPEIASHLVTSLSLAEPALNGRLFTQLEVSRGSAHILTGTLAPGWVVESVETVPQAALGEWFLNLGSDHSQVEVQFASAPSRARSVRVIVSGRFEPSSLAEPLALSTLRMIDWHGVSVLEHLVAVQSIDPYSAEPVAGLRLASQQAIEQGKGDWIDEDFEESAVFDLVRSPENASLRIVPKRSEFEVDITVDSFFAGKEIRHTHHLTVRPNNSRIDRLLVFSTAPLGDKVRWSSGDSETALSAERLADNDPNRVGLPAAGEAWLIRLPQPTSRQMDMVATVLSKLSSRQQLPLLSLPQASAQQGWLYVQSESNARPLLEQAHLQPIPSPESLAGFPPILAAYRYNPADCQTADRSPRLWCTAEEPVGSPKLVSSYAKLESYFLANGRAVHRASYQLEDQGDADLQLQLPRDAKQASAELDGRPLVLMHDHRPSGQYSLRVPKHGPTATLAIHFEWRQSALVSGAELLPPLLNGVSPLTGEWVVWLPEEFSIARDKTTPAGPSFNWQRRLFGPLECRFANDAKEELGLAGMQAFVGNANATRQTPSELSYLPIVTSTKLTHWTAPSPTGNELPPTGWRAYRTTFLAQGPVPLVVTHSPATTAWAVAALLVGVVAGKWLAMGRREMFVIAVAAAACAALLLPVEFASIATGTLLGLLLSLLIILPRPTPADDTPTTTWNRFASIGASAIAIVITLPLSMSAQLPENDAEQATIHSVLIPVDAQGEAEGDKYYVNDAFLRTLLERAGRNSTARRWLLATAGCEGELLERAEAGIAAGEWRLRFDVEVFARDTTVVLPLRQSEANWSDKAMLDGIPTRLYWQPTGDGCALTIPEPGRYTLTITLVPEIQSRGDQDQLALSLPPGLIGPFSLRHPAGAAGWKLTGVSSEIPDPASVNSLSGDLDGSGTLTVAWSHQAALQSEGAGFRVTELQWLHVDGDSVEFDTKLILEGGGRRPESLTVAYDGSWEFASSDKTVLNTSTAASGERQIRVSLPPDDMDRQEVNLRWRLNERQTMGDFHLPSIELLNLPVSQRWLAVSTEPKFMSVFTGSEAAALATANEFRSRWGGELDTTDVELVLPNAPLVRPLTVAVRPRLVEQKLDERLQIVASRDGLQVRYQADVPAGAQEQYQATLAISAAVEIDSIRVQETGQEIPLRWSRPAPDTVCIFLSEGLSEAFQLSIAGHVRPEPSGTYSVPRIAGDREATSLRTQFYRDEDVQLELSGLSLAEPNEVNDSEITTVFSEARPISAHQLSASSFATGRLVVKPNDIQAAADTLTTLTRESDAWWATFQCRGVVEQGELGVVRLQAPAAWGVPLELQSDMPASVEVVPLDERKSLIVVRFVEPIGPGKDLNFQLRGRLATVANARIAAPEILSETPLGGRHFVRVPAIIDSRQTAWAENGVQPSQMPVGMSAADASNATWKVYEVAARPFQLSLRTSEAGSPTAVIRLADTLVATSATAGQLLVTRLVVVSQDLAEAVIELPSDQTLVNVLSDGRPALLRPLGDHRWAVPLGAATLPQFLEIVSQSTQNPLHANPSLAFSRPRLLKDRQPIPAEVSLWSLGNFEPARLEVAGAALVTPTEQSALRLDRLVSIVEAATPNAIESSLADGENWYRPWAARMIAASEAARAGVGQQLSGSAVLQVEPSAEEQLTRATSRLNTWIEQCNEVWLAPDADPTISTAFDRNDRSIWELAKSALPAWSYCVADGDASQLVVKNATAPIAPRQAQAAAVLAVLAASLGALTVLRSPTARDFLCRWPQAIAFVGGLLYWAFLWPGLLGLAVAAGSLWLSLQPGWPGRSVRTEESTVLRIGRST